MAVQPLLSEVFQLLHQGFERLYANKSPFQSRRLLSLDSVPSKCYVERHIWTGYWGQ